MNTLMFGYDESMYEQLDDTKWFLQKGSIEVIWKSRKEGQDELKKTHPNFYHFMKRHEKMANQSQGD